MNKIQVLPDNLINQIAAGEVVERPSSVVKELLENSIDAGATRITVEVEDGGKKLIRITDNGVGISKEDLPLVFERHATSKIATQEDLLKISTMGFRGEAIASIGSVSMMSISSKPKDSDGQIIRNEGGKISNAENYGMPDGTQVTVRNLFFNTPARLKFMKTDQTEFNHITQYMTEAGLIYPYIHFKLMHNGRLISEYAPTNDPIERMHQVFGKTIANELLPVVYLGTDMSIEGYIGKPGIARSSRSSQYLFVNDRPVKNASVSVAVQNAFHSLLPHGKHPFYVINLKVPHEKVDVNVHPRKLEVRFLYQNEIFQVVNKAVKKILETEVLSPELSGDVRSYWKTENIYKTSGNSSSSPVRSDHNSMSIPQAMQFSEEMLKSSDRQHGALEEEKPSLHPVSQIANSYILALGEEGLVIIDQHAAHERVMYNYFLKHAKDKQAGDVESQKLLVPAQLELSHAEIEILNQNLETLKGIGFEIEPFGGNAFVISAVPTSLANADIQKVILEVIDDLKNGDPKKLKEPQHEAICYMACRGAIKFGQQLSHKEMVSLLKQMDEQDQKYTCPHGRPTMINLTFEELEKRFGRR